MLVINNTLVAVHHKNLRKVRKYYEREKRGFSLELDVTLTSE